MPIKSYLVYPHDNQKNTLLKKLSAIEQCETYPAENKDLIVLVTDTGGKHQEEELQQKLQSIPELKMLSMVSGFNTANQN